jgi:hypothetical protein
MLRWIREECTQGFESKKGGGIHGLNILNTLLESVGEEKYFTKNHFWVKFFMGVVHWGCRAFWVCIGRLWGTSKPISYDKVVYTIVLLKKKICNK